MPVNDEIKYYLRELNVEDAKVINGWRNDREVIQYLGSPFRYISNAVDTCWVTSYLNNGRNNNVRLGICAENENFIIGAVYLLSIDWINRSCEFSIWIGNKDYQNKGAGFFATKATLNHAFFDLNLHRISLTVLEDNERAISLYEKVGFIREGVHRNSIYKDGSYRNMIQMSMLVSDYNEKV